MSKRFIIPFSGAAASVLGRVRHDVRKAVAVAALTVGAVWCGGAAASAQETEGGSRITLGTTAANTIEKMSGLNITEDNYSSYVTTDNAGTLSDYESLKKVFFIYNVGTGKFLSPGGYWGSHASLSTEPHPFWLQMKSESKSDQLVHWPYHEELQSGATSLTRPSLMGDFWNLTTVQVGSREGNGRSHATYTKANFVAVKQATEGTATKTTELTTSSDGTAFGQTLTGVNFAGGDYFEFEMNLSSCTGATVGGKYCPENIISLGNNISKWRSDAGQTNLHVYYNTNTKVAEVHYVSEGWTDSRKIFVPINDNKLTLKVAKNDVVVNGHHFFKDVTLEYKEGLEGQTAYFKKDADGFYAVGDDGNYIADASLTSSDGLTALYYDNIYCKPTTLFISSKLNKTSGSTAAEGKFLAFALKTQNFNYEEGDRGVFLDRAIAHLTNLDGTINRVQAVQKAAQWTFNYLDGDAKNTFTMSLTMPFGLQSGKADQEDKTYYLTASPSYVKGVKRGGTSTVDTEKTVYYPFDTNRKGLYTDAKQYEMADLADGMTAAEATADPNAQWKIVTVYDYFMMAKNFEAEMKDPTDVSFIIQDSKFNRESGFLSYWDTDATLTGGTADAPKLRIGIDGYYKTSPKDKDYVSKGLSNQNDELRRHSRYFSVCVSNGGYGKFWQTRDVYMPGWYVVSCNGMTNVGAQLYAEVNGTRKAATTLGSISDTNLKRLENTGTDNLYWPFDQNRPIYNSAALLNDANIKYRDQYNYTSSVMVYVDDASMESPAKLTVGIDVPQDGLSRAAYRQWTVFDKFGLQYGGEKTEKGYYLVLDEERTDLNYLDQTENKYESRILCLNRKMKTGQWNSIVLPVGLTQEQFYGAFGSGTKLAKLNELTRNEIRFQSVTAIGDNGLWMQPNTAYIIKPMQNGAEEATTTTLTKWGSANPDFEVTVPANHYKIPGVTLSAADNPTTVEDGNTKWNFSGTKVSIGGTDYPYIVKSHEAGGQGTMTAYGLLCSNYTTIATGSKKLVTGAYNLANAYVMSDKKLVRLGKAGGASKGLRCWFQYDDGTSQTAGAAPKLFIDGVSDETTSIGDIAAADAEQWGSVAARFADGVYNVQGQLVRRGASTEGLADGLYIVNGRKVSVRE